MVYGIYYYPIQELGFLGGKAVLRKQFGEQIDDPKKSTQQQASGASAWKERKTTCNNPYCRTHGYRYQQERVERVQSTHTNSNGSRYISRVTNAYGVTDDLGVEGSVAGIPMSTKKSRVPSDDESGAVSSPSNVKLKPKRKQSKQIRYTVFGTSVYFFAIDYHWHCRSLDAQLADLVMLFPQLSRLELCRTLERVGNDFDVAIAAIIGENDMANCVDDPENRKEYQPGRCRSNDIIPYILTVIKPGGLIPNRHLIARLGSNFKDIGRF